MKYIWFNNPDPEYSEATLLGASDLDLFTEQDSPVRFIELKKQVLETKKEISEEVFFSERYWSIKIKPWLEEDKLKGVIVLSIDITEERQSYKKLELRGRIIDALTAASNDYLLIVDHNNIIQVISEPLCEDIAELSGIELQAGDSLIDSLVGNAMLQAKLGRPIKKALEGKQTKVDQFEQLTNTSESLKKLYSVKVSSIKGKEKSVIGAEFRGTEITNLIHSKLRV